jgi:hypothetical protein
MAHQNLQLLSGRATDSYMSKGAIRFCVAGEFMNMDVPGSIRRPFDDGAEIEVVTRRGLIFRSGVTALAFRVQPDGRARAAGRWRAAVIFLVGLFTVGVFLFLRAVDGDWPDETMYMALGAVLFLYGGFQLWQISAAKSLLESTPNKSLERTRDR